MPGQPKRFHWRPALGTHSLVWDVTQKIAGKDPDFSRRDLWEAIESGNGPEYELAIQLVPAADEHRFDFGVLDRKPDNFFAETEQVAFHTANVVPGVDFTNDPLLQARNFSYLDTQLIRLGSPNFAQLPVNRPVAPVNHHQRDGYGQHRIDQGSPPISPTLSAVAAPRCPASRRASMSTTPSRSTDERCVSVARAPWTSTARRRCSGTA